MDKISRILRRAGAVSLALVLAAAPAGAPGIIAFASDDTPIIPFDPHVPTETPASSFEYETGNDGKITITKFTGTENEVSVPAKIDNIPVSKIAENAFAGANVTKLTLPDGVESIGSNAFSSCTGMTRLTLPASLRRIGSSAFFNCSSLYELKIPQGVEEIDASAFRGCSSLISTDLPDSLVTIGAAAFESCVRLGEITLPEGVTAIPDNCFALCTGLEKATLPETVFSVGSRAFSGCTALEEIVLPSRLSSVGSYAFLGCRSISSITVPESVTDIGEMAFGYYLDEQYSLTDGFILCGRNGTAAEDYAVLYGVSFFDDQELPLSGLSLDKNEIIIHSGEDGMVTALLSPQQTSLRHISWEINDPDQILLPVDKGAKNIYGFTAVKRGRAVVTVKSDNGLSAECRIVSYGVDPAGADTQAGCTTDGSRAYYYSPELDKYFEDENAQTEIDDIDTWKTIPATGHTASAAVRENEKAAGCTEPGSYDEVVYCSVCGEVIRRETKTIPATGHTASAAVRENEKAAGCTEPGSYDEVVYCSVCGEVISRETKTIKPTGHSWGEWKVVKDHEERVCSHNSSHKEKREIQKVQIVLSESKVSIVKGKTIQLKARLIPADTKNNKVSWKSSNKKAAIVNSSGKVVALSSGTATITATSATGDVSSCKIVVTNPSTKVKLDKTKATVAKGKVLKLKAAMTPSNTTDILSWKSSNSKVASVNSKGEAVGKKAGTATITVKTTSGKAASCKVTVNIPATKVKLSKTKATLRVRKKLTLKATMNPSGTTDKLTWSTSNKKIATVKNGKVTAKKAGTVTITVKTTSGKTAKCKITVKKK